MDNQITMQTPDTPQLTPIEKAIAELDLSKYNNANEEHQLFYNNLAEKIKAHLLNFLPYERKYLRDSAEKAREASRDYNFVKYERPDILDNPNQDKQAYLNQNHPL